MKGDGVNRVYDEVTGEGTEISMLWLIVTELHPHLIVLKYKRTESAVYKYHATPLITYRL